LASTHTIDVFFYGDPAGTWRQLMDWIHGGTTEGLLWQQIWVTLQEALLGFVIGVVLGVVCGIVLGRVKLLSEILAVYIGAFNSIPRIVLGSIFIIWFGLGMQSKIALAVLLIFFNVFFNAFQGAREVDGGLIANAKLLGASRLDVILQVVVPSAFSWIIASLRVAFGLAITGSVVGEMLGAQQGLGTLISQAQGNFNPNGVYAGLLVTTIVALGAPAGTAATGPLEDDHACKNTAIRTQLYKPSCPRVPSPTKESTVSMFHRKLVLAVAALTAAAGIASCSSSKSGSAASAGSGSSAAPITVKIAVSNSTNQSYIPLILAQQLGFFRKQGLNVQIVSVTSGAQTFSLLLSDRKSVV